MNADALATRKAALETRYEELNKVINDASVEQRRLEGAWQELDALEKQLTTEGEAATQEKPSGKSPGIHRDK